MQAGKIRYLATIQRFAPTRDAIGGTGGGTWVTIHTRWASGRSLRDSERYVAEQIHAIEIFVLEMRYVADITPNDRILFRGRTLNVFGSHNVNERNVTTEAVVYERTPMADATVPASTPAPTSAAATTAPPTS